MGTGNHALRRKVLEAAARRMLADRLRRGDSIAQIARGLQSQRYSLTRLRVWLMQLAREHQLPYRRHYTEEERRQAVEAVVDGGHTFREAAKLTGIPKTTVHRLVQRERMKVQGNGGRVRYEPELWRCPTHGLVRLRPCVACMAMQRSANSKGDV